MTTEEAVVTELRGQYRALIARSSEALLAGGGTSEADEQLRWVISTSKDLLDAIDGLSGEALLLFIEALLIPESRRNPGIDIPPGA